MGHFPKKKNLQAWKNACLRASVALCVWERKSVCFSVCVVYFLCVCMHVCPRRSPCVCVRENVYWCACVCFCFCVCMHVFARWLLCVWEWANRTNTYMHAYTYVHTHINICVHMHIHTRTYTNMFTNIRQIQLRANTCMHTYTHIHTHIYTELIVEVARIEILHLEILKIWGVFPFHIISHCIILQPIADRVAQNLEIISKKCDVSTRRMRWRYD